MRGKEAHVYIMFICEPIFLFFGEEVSLKGGWEGKGDERVAEARGLQDCTLW